jgi:hypothetical protein
MPGLNTDSNAHRVAQILRDLDERVTDLEQDHDQADGDVRIARRVDDEHVSAAQQTVAATDDPTLRFTRSLPAGRPSPTKYDQRYAGATPRARSDTPPGTLTGWGAREWAAAAPDEGAGDADGFGVNFGSSFGAGETDGD